MVPDILVVCYFSLLRHNPHTHTYRAHLGYLVYGNGRCNIHFFSLLIFGLFVDEKYRRMNLANKYTII